MNGQTIKINIRTGRESLKTSLFNYYIQGETLVYIITIYRCVFSGNHSSDDESTLLNVSTSSVRGVGGSLSAVSPTSPTLRVQQQQPLKAVTVLNSSTCALSRKEAERSKCTMFNVHNAAFRVSCYPAHSCTCLRPIANTIILNILF